MKIARKLNVTRYDNVRDSYYAEVEIDDYANGKLKSYYLGHEEYGDKILMWQMPIFDSPKLNITLLLIYFVASLSPRHLTLAQVEPKFKYVINAFIEKIYQVIVTDDFLFEIDV